MTRFRVWAPAATRMDLQLYEETECGFEAGRRVPMTREARGWWSVDVDEAGHGTDYAFCPDGGEPLPDPRSPWQPYGVHGPSRVVDHDIFPRTDDGWQSPPLSSAVIYELHVGTFTPQGTFEAVIDKLPYLHDLGVTHIELMPVSEFAGSRGWGYDGVDLYAPHHTYGGPEGLARLVDACHREGLSVILDVVYNHLGPEGAYIDRYGPYFTERHATAWGAAVNLDGPESDEVRRFIIDNALMWLRDYHMDGLRLDAVHAIVDASAWHILEELVSEVEALEATLGRHLFLIAESNLNNPRIVESQERGGYGLDAQWSDDLHHAVHTLLTGESDGYYQDFGRLADLARALEDVFVYDGQYSPYRRRRHGRPVGALSRHRFIGCLQNHDQVGNRARGERIGHLVNLRRLRIGAALVLTAPTVPLIFQGEEWGATAPFQFFADYEDPDLVAAVRDGRRREVAAFGGRPEGMPDPQAVETFACSVLNWDEMNDEPHAGILDWYRRLIRLRRERADLSMGAAEATCVRYDEAAGWLAMERGAMTVVCNLAEEARHVPLVEGRPRELLLTSDESARMREGGIDLPPETVVVLG